MPDIEVSVVMPVKNGQRYLDSALSSIFAQKINKEFEVIIIDSGSVDESLNIIGKYPVKIYQIKEQDFNHGLTRNFGVSCTKGRYIILITQDTIPADNHWMRNLISNLENDSQVAGAYSRQLPHFNSSVLTRMRANRFFVASTTKRESRIDDIKSFQRLTPKEKYRLCNFDNVSSCIRKTIWEKFPFPKTDFAEDLEWAKLVLEAGYKIVYDPQSQVYHSHDFSASQWHQRNRLNYKKLNIFFGLNTINSIFKLPIFFLLYVARDIYCLWKDKQPIKIIVLNIYPIISFSFFGALGQYQGLKDSGKRCYL